MIKTSIHPHDDLQSDMKIFAHIIVDGYILLQTVSVEATADQNSWEVRVGWEMYALTPNQTVHY
jgi:hypothetical protein